ncbi:MAG: hypothetical protein ACYS80_18895 [Planctomycetota bacterium]|jgi:hypothetical protein
MPKIIKNKCNGPNRCINEIDLEAVVNSGKVDVYRVAISTSQPRYRERYVLKCKQCSIGEVVITREMIEENL